MHGAYNFDWQMPDGEPLGAFLERFAAEEARRGPRFAEFTASAAQDESQGILRGLAAFLARHPHYAPRRTPRVFLDCLETLGQWQIFLAWACREGRMTHDKAQSWWYALTSLRQLECGGIEVALN
jgi:hypothetical protein